jgi:hypothetical protein
MGWLVSYLLTDACSYSDAEASERMTDELGRMWKW